MTDSELQAVREYIAILGWASAKRVKTSLLISIAPVPPARTGVGSLILNGCSSNPTTGFPTKCAS
jgi:hypothetical protein